MSFPLQKIPFKCACNKWQYFIRHISENNNLLLVPLGNWTLTPYQFFPYVLGSNAQFLFQLKQNNWEIYYYQPGTRNIYIPANIKATKLPKKWIPLNVVIRMSNGTIRGISPNSAMVVSNNISHEINHAQFR